LDLRGEGWEQEDFLSYFAYHVTLYSQKDRESKSTGITGVQRFVLNFKLIFVWFVVHSASLEMGSLETLCRGLFDVASTIGRPFCRVTEHSSFMA
jgi:hypothetical protein